MSGRPRANSPKAALALGSWAGLVALGGIVTLLFGIGPAGAREGDAALTHVTNVARTVGLTSASAPPPVATSLPAAAPTTAAPTTAVAVIAAPLALTPASAPTTVAPVEQPAPFAAVAPAAAVEPDIDPGAESALFEDHNQRRAGEGLPPLLRDPCLDEVARRWARQMAGTGTLQHNPAYAEEIDGCITFTSAGENVGHSPGPEPMAAAFWESDTHRANIAGPYQYVGIGVVVGPDGMLWAALEFAAG
jgi:uncharacterized protein YkwD